VYTVARETHAYMGVEARETQAYMGAEVVQVYKISIVDKRYRGTTGV
jgi:hypothetical protein